MWEDEVYVMALIQETFGQIPLALGRIKLQALLHLPPGYRPLALLVGEDTVRLQTTSFPGNHLPYTISLPLRDWLARQGSQVQSLCFVRTESGKRV